MMCVSAWQIIKHTAQISRSSSRCGISSHESPPAPTPHYQHRLGDCDHFQDDSIADRIAKSTPTITSIAPTFKIVSISPSGPYLPHRQSLSLFKNEILSQH
jgi:hypothetical protein